MAKVSKNPWKDILDSLIRLFPSKQVDCQFLIDGVYVFEPNMEVHIPYPKAAKFPEGKLNLHHLRTVISLLEEPSLNVFKSEGKLTLKEASLCIDIPHNTQTDCRIFWQTTKVNNRVVSENLMDIFKGLVGPLKRSKSAGLAENIYWDRSTLYSYNGVVLSTYTGMQVLAPIQIVIPKNIILFLSSFESDDIATAVSLFADGSVGILLHTNETKEELVSIRFTQPNVAPPVWEELVPKTPQGWMPIPAMFFRLSDIAIELANVYNSQIQLEWTNKLIVASSTPQYSVAFEFSEDTPFPNTKRGLLDILYIKPVLEYSERMGWQDNYIVFAGGNYRFFMALG